MHDWLTAFWQRKGALTIKHTDLTYATEILGSGRIFKALASFFGSYFDPLVPVAPDHIATSNGLSPMIEHVAAAISDPEDAWLIPAYVYLLPSPAVLVTRHGLTFLPADRTTTDSCVT